LKPPGRPTDLSFELGGEPDAYALALLWRPADESAEGFRIWRVPPQGYEVIAEVGPRADSYKETVKTAGQYCYAVEAFNAIGSNQSLVECVVVGDVESTGVPQLPINLSVELARDPLGGLLLRLTWEDFAVNERQFNIYRDPGGFALYDTIEGYDGVGALVVYQDFVRVSGRYCYIVSAENRFGESARTISVCATIPVQ
jgi:hypothetical protein